MDEKNNAVDVLREVMAKAEFAVNSPEAEPLPVDYEEPSRVLLEIMRNPKSTAALRVQCANVLLTMYARRQETEGGEKVTVMFEGEGEI